MKYGFMLFILLMSFSAAGEIYKWTNDKGRVHYSDAKPPEDAAKPSPTVEEVELTPITIMDDGSVNNTSNETVKLADQMLEKLESLASGFNLSDKTSSTASKDKVEIYTTSWCVACKKAKSWLRSNGIRYTEFDVEKSRDAALRMRRLGGGGGVPFTVINGDTISGFSPDQYKAALAR